MNIVKREYHPNGVVSYEETASGHQTYFNEQGKTIKKGFCNRISAIFEYDEKGRLMAWQHTGYAKYRREHSSDGKQIREWEEDGKYDAIMEYDDAGNLIHFFDKVNPSSERWYGYDADGKRIYTWDSNGNPVD